MIFVFSFFANANNLVLNLSDWPADVVERMKKEVPELDQKKFDAITLNLILKKLDQKMQFNSLKLVQTNEDELRLVGEISAVVDKIDFQGLDEISEAEALTLMNLNIKNALDEDSLKTAVDKLVQYYRDLGYRFAAVQFEVISVSTIQKNIIFKVQTKKRTRLTQINVEGVDPLSQELIERQLKKLFFKPLLNQETLTQLNIDLRRYLSQQGYFLTQVTSPQIIFSADELSARLIYKLKKTTQYSIEIINAIQFTHNYIENDVLGLETYSSKDVNFGSEIVEKLKSFYLSEGYPHIDIAYYERKENEKIMMSFNLDEGPYTQLTKLSITGQHSKNENDYKDKFFKLSTAKLNGKTYVKEDIESAAKNLLTELQNEGFVNARLGRLQIYTDRERPQDGVALIQLDEGPQVTIDHLDFVGQLAETPEQLQKVIKLNPGDTLNLNQLEQALILLKNEYLNQGYIEYKLLNETKDLITYSEKNTKADLKFEFQTGPKVEVQSILLEGNERTHDKVILTEIDFKPGDILTPAKIEESISRLQRTGHFSSVDISTIESGTPISQRTVLVKVVERDPGVFTIGAGATNENNGTIRGFTGIAYRNIGGWGRGLSLRGEGNYNFADVKYLESKIILGGVEPYLFETRSRLRLNITRSRTISDISIKKVTELNLGVLSIEQDFTSHVTGIWDLWSVATYVDHGISPEDNNGIYESQVIGSTGPTIDIDYRDNLFNPTRGSFSRFSIEYAPEILTNNNVDDFIRLTGQSTWYFPFKNSSVVFAQSVSGGYIQDTKLLGFGVPFDKKGFTLGGRTTIRGFGSSEFFPSSQTDSPEYIGASYKLTTFSSYELVKSELRFPLVQKWDLMGALFYDGGQVLIDGLEFSDKWRDAIGVGLRYNTPIGPLNLEYAQKLDKKEGESTGAFHLSVGVF